MGPYTDEAPDLVVNFAPGYRASWATALGGLGPTCFEDNVKKWSGDHIVDPLLALARLRPPGQPGELALVGREDGGRVALIDDGGDVVGSAQGVESVGIDDDRDGRGRDQRPHRCGRRVGSAETWPDDQRLAPVELRQHRGVPPDRRQRQAFSFG